MECQQKIYDVSISSADNLTQWYAQNLIENNGTSLQIVTLNNQLNYSKWNYNYLKQTTLKLNVFYESLVYTNVYETPSLTIDSLIDYLGLFWGMSLLSLIEAVKIFFHVIYFICKKRIDKV